jgi:hypothetical protein
MLPTVQQHSQQGRTECCTSVSQTALGMLRRRSSGRSSRHVCAFAIRRRMTWCMTHTPSTVPLRSQQGRTECCKLASQQVRHRRHRRSMLMSQQCECETVIRRRTTCCMSSSLLTTGSARSQWDRLACCTLECPQVLGKQRRRSMLVSQQYVCETVIQHRMSCCTQSSMPTIATQHSPQGTLACCMQSCQPEQGKRRRRALLASQQCECVTECHCRSSCCTHRHTPSPTATQHSPQGKAARCRTLCRSALRTLLRRWMRA